jgi:hypothetical protein
VNTGSLNFSAGLHQAQRLAVALGPAHAEVAQAPLLGVTALLVAQHHAGVAVESREAADDRQVVGEVPVAMQLDEIREDLVDVIQRVGTLRMAGDLGDLPGRQVAVDVLGQLLALLAQLVDLFRDVDRGLGLHVAQFLDLALEFGNRLLEIEKGLLGQGGSPLYRSR